MKKKVRKTEFEQLTKSEMQTLAGGESRKKLIIVIKGELVTIWV